ncbi:MAG: D-alanyl-D-alanine carboxypeptidase family protein [Solirubrobacteraceae bacterium]
MTQGVRAWLCAATMGMALVAATPSTAMAAPGADAASGPRLSARSAVLIEASTGTPIFGRAAGSERAIASTTKLMTALLTLRRAPLSRVFTVPHYGAGAAESQIGLRPGERVRVDDLLRGLLLPSANDAAETLAVGVAGSRGGFVNAMNREARRLGLRRTHYSTPVGLDSPGNFSDAYDLARLAIVVRRNRFFAHTVDQSSAVLRSGSHRRVVVTRNRLVRTVPWVNGIKTGHTSGAGYVLVASATRQGMTLVSVVLGTPSESARDADSLRLLRYGFAGFGLVRPVRRGQIVVRARVRDRPKDRIPLFAARGLTRVERRGDRDVLFAQVPRELKGPIAARARVGTLLVRVRGRVVARIAILTGQAVKAPSAVASVGRALSGPITLLLLVVLAGGVAVFFAVRRRRRQAARRRGQPRNIETA